MRRRIRFWGVWVLMCCMGLCSVVEAQGVRERRRGFAPRFHDPGTPLKEKRTWWIFSTGQGISAQHSTDLKNWTAATPVLQEFPAWHREVVPDQKGHLWAPDIVKVGKEYRLYYSVSSFGKNTSAIGLLVNSTLDPENPRYKWEEKGIVVQSKREDDFNAIDPALFVDEDGSQWLSFGSFWSGIQLLELDPETGKAHPERKELRRIAWQESIEAPALLREGKYVYLFVNWGICCRGVDSTYEMRVGRSESVEGPFLDKEGRDMATGGGSLLLATEGDEIGPGHASFVRFGKTTRMFYHYYDRKQRGASRLGTRALSWDEEGWPVLGEPGK